MSIIHEALQKVEAEKGRERSVLASAIQKRAEGNGSYRRLILLIALLVCTVGIVFLYNDDLGNSEGDHIHQSVQRKGGKAEGGVNKQASAAFQEAREQNLRGIVLFKAGNLEGAIIEFEAAVNKLPSFAEVHNNLGQALAIGSKTAEAEVHFKKALELRPDYPEGLNNYGALLNGRGESSEAIKHLRRAISIKPTYPDPYLNMAISLENSGNLKEAISYYNKYLDFTDSNTPLAGEIMNKVTLLRRIYLAEVER
ncbi:MAG: tetratricopeptide repeat protein [Deltaproteobacteria bacterium]|nr:tetratricopeptide repeat protein [Deltaproteobacteria bacterium]